MRWFKPFGFIFYPMSIAGWIVTLLALAFCGHIFLFIEDKSHSVSDTFYGVFPYWAPIFLTWIWIANRTSGRCGPRISN